MSKPHSPTDRPVALVTGASRGIGRAIAERLGSGRHAVAVNYFRSPDAANEVVQAIEATGGKAFAVQGSVALADISANAPSRGQPIRCGGHDEAVHSVAFSQKGKWMASAGYDCWIWRW